LVIYIIIHVYTFLVIVSATQSRFYFMPVHFYVLLGFHLFIQIAHSTCMFNTNTTVATSGAGTAYPSGTSEFTPVHLVICVMFLCLSRFFILLLVVKMCCVPDNNHSRRGVLGTILCDSLSVTCGRSVVCYGYSAMT
jgi:hypothetical protein